MKHSHPWKLTAALMTVLGLALAVFYGVVSYSFRQYHVSSAKAQLLGEAERARNYLGPRFTSSAGFMQDMVSRLGRELGLRVSVISPEGWVVADSEVAPGQINQIENHLRRPEIQAALKHRVGESLRFSVTLRRQMLYAAAVLGENGRGGFLRLAVPLEQIKRDPTPGDLLLLMLVLIFLAAAATVAGIVARFFRPLNEIAAVAKGIALGDFSRRVRIHTGGDVQDLVGAVNQIADQAQARIDEMTAGRLRLEAVLLSMFDGLMVVDAQGIILLLNKTARDLFKVDGDVKGRRPLEVIRHLEIQELVDRALALERGVETREFTVLLPQRRVLLAHATAVVRNLSVDGAVLVFHDITDLRRLEEVRKDFVANVSHELRTPLANIRGYTETLLEGALDDREHAREFLNIMQEESRRLAKIVDDLLELARIESGRLTPELKPCDLRHICARVVKLLDLAASQKQVTIYNQIPEGIPPVMADAEALAGVFHNLLDNAVNYNRPGGEVRVTARDRGSAVEIAVADNGIGIPRDELDRIFERFYRVDKSRSRQLGGTGLGLAIVRHIIDSHDGEVRVESEPGRGSTFFFILAKAPRA